MITINRQILQIGTKISGLQKAVVPSYNTVLAFSLTCLGLVLLKNKNNSHPTELANFYRTQAKKYKTRNKYIRDYRERTCMF